jgi:hypothetical protein
MKIRASWFNLYFIGALAVAAGSGCQTQSHHKEMCVLRVHVEAHQETDTNRCTVVQISRDHPVDLQIDSNALLTESDVKEAKVVEDPGGFAIRLQFNRKGSWLLEEYTGGNRGRHFAIFSQFVKPGDRQLHTEGRWLAAPRITRNIADGVLVFSPDASREEADEIVQGLNNEAKKLAQDSIWSN